MLGERSDQRGLLEAGQLYLDPVGRDTFYPPVADWRHCEASCSTMPTTTSTRNDGWWRSIDWLGWSSWASGRRYFGRVKTKFQLYLAATVANLTLLANQAGVDSDPGDDPVSFAMTAPIGSNHGVDRHFLPTWMLAWLRSPTLALSLFPTGAFRPAF